MLKQETKKNSRGKKILIFCLVLILLIGAVVSVKIINHNKNIKDLMSRDIGSFESGVSATGEEQGFRLSLYDKDIDTKYYKKEWNLDLNPKQNNFVYKDGLEMNGTKITAGTWERDDDGDYKLYVGGKIYAYIIEKSRICGVVKRKPDYFILFAKNSKKYKVNKPENNLWYYSKVEK